MDNVVAFQSSCRRRSSNSLSPTDEMAYVYEVNPAFGRSTYR
jgi:hypothetical protein